jgi:dephospho-CoA kinase
VARFGPGILDSAGNIDRKRLGAVVFQDPAALQDLNGIIHPLVWREEERLMAECAARGPGAVGIVEAAILIETGSHTRFEQLVLTVCDPETQIARAMARDGATRAQVLERLARQWPLERKLPHAHHVIDTSGTIEETLGRTRTVWESLRSMSR